MTSSPYYPDILIDLESDWWSTTAVPTKSGSKKVDTPFPTYEIVLKRFLFCSSKNIVILLVCLHVRNNIICK